MTTLTRWRPFPAFAFAACAAVTFSACAEHNCLGGRPGVDYVEGQIVVIFVPAVASEEEARTVVEQDSHEVLGFLPTEHQVEAFVSARRGAECDAVNELDRDPRVDAASLRLLVHAM